MLEKYLKRNDIKFKYSIIGTGNIYSWDHEYFPLQEYPCIFIENPSSKLFKYCDKHNIIYKYWKFTDSSIYFFMDKQNYESYENNRKKHNEILEHYWQEYHKQLIKKDH